MSACAWQAAVEDIVRKDALNQPRWQSLDSLIGDTRSMFELGILGATQDILQSQAAMLAILRCFPPSEQVCGRRQ